MLWRRDAELLALFAPERDVVRHPAAPPKDAQAAGHEEVGHGGVRAQEEIIPLPQLVTEFVEEIGTSPEEGDGN